MKISAASGLNLQLSIKEKTTNTRRLNFHQRRCQNERQEPGAKGHVITQEVSETDKDELAGSARSSLVQATLL